MKIHQLKEHIAEEAGKKVSKVLDQYKNIEILFLVSGGSSLNLLEYIDDEVLGPHITVVALDERFSRDEEINNFLQIKKTSFYDKVLENDVNIVDTSPEEGETIESLADRWNDVITAWKKENPKGVIIATAGIGEDGHVAGMMPFPEDEALFKKLFQTPKQYVTGYDAGIKNKYNLRITSTMTLLKEASHVISYVVGNKKLALKNAQEIVLPFNECPARILWELPKVDLFTDIVL